MNIINWGIDKSDSARQHVSIRVTNVAALLAMMGATAGTVGSFFLFDDNRYILVSLVAIISGISLTINKQGHFSLAKILISSFLGIAINFVGYFAISKDTAFSYFVFSHQGLILLSLSSLPALFFDLKKERFYLFFFIVFNGLVFIAHTLVLSHYLSLSTNPVFSSLNIDFFILPTIVSYLMLHGGILVLKYLNTSFEEKLTAQAEELQKKNKSLAAKESEIRKFALKLEAKVNERTKEITAQKEEIENQASQLAQKNEYLKEANKEKDAILGFVAHDLRSPFNKIMGMTYLLAESEGLTEMQKDFYEKITQAVKNGSSLIDDLLYVQSIEYKNDNVEINEVDLQGFADETTTDFAVAAQEKKIDLFVSNNTKDLSIMTDEQKLRRIIHNLISNAIKFSLPGSSVHVSVDYQMDSVKLMVKDEGPGISEEDQKKLFGKFQTLTARPTSGESSTGLGLSIVKKLIESLNGTIRVKSKLSYGTTFTVLIPAKHSVPSTV